MCAFAQYAQILSEPVYQLTCTELSYIESFQVKENNSTMRAKKPFNFYARMSCS